jgi:hypothetical protein
VSDSAGYGQVAITGDAWINERARRYLGGLRPLPELPAELRHPGHPNQKVHAGGKRGLYAGGGDLLADGDPEALATQIDRAAAKTGGRNGDGHLFALADRQGFTGKPQLVTKKEMDGLVRDGATELHRGASGAGPSGKSAAAVHNQFRGGDYFAGHGHFGNGTYAGPDRQRSVDFYSDGTPGSMLRLAVRKDAKVATFSKVFDEQEAWLAKQPKGSRRHAVFSDVGRYATARGIDVIHIPRGGFNDEYLILNRTAVAAQKAR